MSLTENGNGMVMPVGPMYGNGGDGWWVILFLKEEQQDPSQ